MYIPGRTHKEWREDNREALLQAKKEWYENNEERRSGSIMEGSKRRLVKNT